MLAVKNSSAVALPDIFALHAIGVVIGLVGNGIFAANYITFLHGANDIETNNSTRPLDSTKLETTVQTRLVYGGGDSVHFHRDCYHRQRLCIGAILTIESR
jgi:hypothetical protein